MEAITTNTSHRFKPLQLSGGWGLSHFWGSSTTECKYWGQTGVRLSGGKEMVFFPCLGTGRLSYSYSPNQSCLPLSSSWLFPWHLDFFALNAECPTGQTLRGKQHLPCDYEERLTGGTQDGGRYSQYFPKRRTHATINSIGINIWGSALCQALS